ncbi:MBG domain-containing protein [Flavobacterium hiemivividum]|uniref:T9SS type A sorting domain-containing protein n=1 Tax=Flavobacterium hiemivividum TaxID=2541734 RepID=A0A4V2Z0N2_9FLAO|nr:MBG domain-containing protein [Flavobacterium hiemivividum]TDE01598.1 T9SS type A sorting domain-containing protein [Flavobacterium hiemivividum]
MEKYYLLSLLSLLCLVFLCCFYVLKTKTIPFFKKHLALPRYTLITCLLLFTIAVQSQTIKYVTVNGAGTKDGSSWSNASDNLQKTISLSDENTEVWIAKGIYTPKVAPSPNKNSQDRNNTFGLKKGVKLYGGFSGAETSFGQRNIVINETILSGNLGGGNFAHHVVLIHALEDNENYYLNGLTISDGKCDDMGYYNISEEISSSISVNDQVKDKYPDWYVSMTESPYYNWVDLGLKATGIGKLPGIVQTPGGGAVWVQVLNTSYPKNKGGGIYNIKGVLKLEYVTFKNNSGILGAAVSTELGGKTTITDCTFINNNAINNGGAVVSTKSSLTIERGTFEDNSALLGGAIVDDNGKLFSISGVTFTNNKANSSGALVGYGGAIFFEKLTSVNSSIRTINDCTFNNNIAEVAGAIFAGENISNLKITNSKFNNNEALKVASNTLTGGGGAITLQKTINSEITSNTFKNNKASKGIGGACVLDEVNGVILSGNTFSENTSLLGGALCLLKNKSTTTLTGNTFTKNSVTISSNYSSSGYGGAITSYKDNDVQVTGKNVFTENTATIQGGAIYFETSTGNSIINDNTFNKNSSSKNGGALYAVAVPENTACKLTLSKNVFENNTAIERGGGVYLINALTTQVFDNSFIGNKSYIGAAIDIESSAKTLFYNNKVINNVGTTTSEGAASGIVTAYAGINKFYNNVFTGNNVFTTIFFANATVEFVNNTVWKEVTYNGIYIFSKNVKIHNNILVDIAGPNAFLADVKNNVFKYDPDFIGKNNNVQERYLYFADEANNDFNLTGCSPFLNKGDNSSYLEEYSTKDILGNTRKVNGIDIGAYENILGVSGKTVPTVVATQSFCNAATVNNLQATGTTIKWYSQSSGGSPLDNNLDLVSGNTYYASQTVNNCESERASVIVSVSSTTAPTAQSPQNFIIGQQGAKIVVSGSNLKWYTQAIGGTSSTILPALNMSSENSITYWVTQTNANNCESTRTKIVVNVTKIPLTVKAIAKTKVFDGLVYPNANHTVTYSGFESGDNIANSITGTLAFSGNATVATEPGVYTITPKGISSTKYTVLFEDGTLEIKSNLILTDNILYVNLNGNGDGTSWNNALSNLEVALTRAANINAIHTDNNDPKKVKKIFVAKGTYQLASGKSYIMPENIEIYGGFDPGNGITNLTHQRITDNLNTGSVLRGNNSSVIKNDDNSLTSTSVLNGFTITNGYANNGGGIYNKKASPKFENCILKINNATANGGAVYNENANATWINCLIISNTAPNGASIYNNASSPILLNTTIADNTGAQGATMYNENGSTPRIVNTISVKNSSDIINNVGNTSYENSLIQGVNGITKSTNVFDINYTLLTNSPALNTGQNNPASLALPAKDLKGKSRIINSTIDMGVFERNKTQTITAISITKEYGDAPFTHGTASSGLPLEYVSSSNTAIAKIEDGKIKVVGTGTTTITVSQSGNNIEYDAASATFILTVNKKTLTVRADNKNKIQDNLVFTGFSVTYSGFESGDSEANSLSGSLAFSGNATIATEAGIYKIIPQGISSTKYTVLFEDGTLEIKSNLILTDNILYVNPNGSGDGTSWNNALSNLEVALTRAANINAIHTDNNDPKKVKKIFVAKGTYQLASGKSYIMPKNIEIYGGFDPANGITNLTHQRITDNLNTGSILRGNNSSVIKNYDNSLTSTSVLNGFTITNGSANNGGGIYNKKASPKFENCILKINNATANGGAVYNENANTTWINCLIISNTAPNGASIYNNASSPILLNTTIADNTGAQGATMYNENGSTPRIVNTISVKNSSDIVNNVGNASYENSLIQGVNGITQSTNVFDINYTLLTNSPALNTGQNNPASLALPAKDLKGKSRIINSITDMGVFERNKTQTIVAVNITKKYGDAPFTHGTASSGSPLEYVSSNAAIAKIEDGKIQVVGVGTAIITVNQSGNNAEYDAASTTFIITAEKRTLTVSADNKVKLQDGSVFTGFTVTYSGFVFDDIPFNSLSGNVNYAGNAITATAIGNNYVIIPSGYTSSKYDIVYTNGILTIEPDITLTDGTLYVKKGATGNGTSWSNALGEVRDALDIATIINSSVTTATKIFVSVGQYTPNSGQSFKMLKNVNMYGGFDPDNGITTLSHKRKFAQSILVGNSNTVIKNDNNGLTNDDIIDGFTIGSSSSNNVSQGGGIYNRNSSPTIVNCIIRDNAMYQFNYNITTYGGGMFNDNSSPILINCIIKNNTVGVDGSQSFRLGFGSAMYNVNISNPKLYNCTITENRSKSQNNGNATAIVNDANSTTSLYNSIYMNNNIGVPSGITLYNSIFQKDGTIIEGLYNNSVTVTLDAIFKVNSIALKEDSFAKDKGNNTYYTFNSLSAYDISGYNRTVGTIDVGAEELRTVQTIIASNITKNYGDLPFTNGTASSGLPLEYISSSDNSIAKIEDGKINLVGNGTATISVKQPGDDSQYAPASSSFTVTVNKKELIVSADNKVKVKDNFVFNGFTVTYDGLVNGDTPQNSLSGNLTFSGTAVTATNLGSGYVVTPSGFTSSKYNITYNNGSLRIESDVVLTDGTLYVKKGATGNGTSWTDALGELADALVIAKSLNSSSTPGVTPATKIFVAKGSYTPKYSARDNTNFIDEGRDNSFLVLDGVKLYGGFDGAIANESLIDRKIQENKTILDGASVINHIITVANATGNNEIDGFTISKGAAANAGYGTEGTVTINGKLVTREYGGGLRVHSSNVIIKNCVISENSSGHRAGGVYITDQSNVTLYNTLFYGNSAYHFGGTGSSMGINDANVKIVNATFGDNSTHIATYGASTLEVLNSIFGTNGVNTEINRIAGTVTIKNSLLSKAQSFYSAMTLANNSYEQPADFIDVNANNFALKTSSVAVDKGSNAFYNVGIAGNKDLSGISRYFNTIVDMGCYESKLPQIITATALTKTYGEVDFIHPMATVNSSLPLTFTNSSDVTVATIINGMIRILKAGTTTITITQVGNENYAPLEKTFVLTVGKATLTVKANDKTKFASNTAMPTANYDVSYTGFVNGDDSSKLAGTLLYSGNAISKTEIGIYKDGITPSGLTSGNYSFVYQNGTLKILPNTILIDNTLYVKQGATAGGDGSSWQLALNDLSLGLRYASILNSATPNTVNKIFVAKGSYTPKYSARDNTNFIDEGRDNSFLVLDGVKLYGGFDGAIANESLIDRKIQENKTILDGASVINHIITVANATGNNEIDGFTISKGAAANAGYGTEGTVTINGKLVTREYGGGLRVHSSNVIIKNCVISENSSGHRAGGVYITDQSNVTLYNTLFYGNSAYHFGATGSSMGINDANVKIVNATFGDNSTHIATYGASTLEVLNSIFGTNGVNTEINRIAGTVTIKNSLLSKAQSFYSAMTLANNSYEQPADFIDVNANNFALKSISVAIDKGDNTLYNSAIAGNKDFENNSRFLNTIIDMGCYESKLLQTIDITNITKKYTDPAFVIGNASSSLPLTYSSGTKTVAYITKDNKIEIVGVGQTIITVTQSGDEIYGFASKSFILTVEKGDVIATLDPETYTYDGSKKYLNVTGLPTGTTVYYEDNGQIEAGDYVVKAFISGGQYYNDTTISNTLKINKTTLSGILFTPNTFTYNGFNKHPEIAGTLPEGVIVVYSNTQNNAGVYNNVKATISGSNYNDLVLTTSMTIKKGDLSDAISLLEKEEVYDGTIKELSFAGTLPEGVTATYTNNNNINVGAYDVAVNINGGINYNDKQLIAKLIILKGNLDTNAVLVSTTYTYDGSEKSVTIDGTLPNQVTVSYSNNNKKEVGEYKVYAVLSKPNYNDKILEANLIIEPKSLNVIAQGEISKVYNANSVVILKASNFALEGVVNGDTVELNNPFSGELNDKNIGENKAVLVNDLKVSGADAKNYILSSTSLMVNIGKVTPIKLDVSLKGNVSKIYDATTKAVLAGSNFELNGILENEIVTLNNPSLGEYDTKDVGTNKAVTISNLTISGDDASNYILKSQSTSGQIGEISSQAITVTAAAKTKVYGTVDPSLTYVVSPSLEAGDSFTGSLSRAAGTNVGAYGITSTLNNANYAITYVPADFTITAKAITVTAATKTKVYGTVDPSLTYVVSPSLETGDSFTGSLTRAAGENVATYGVSSTLNNTNYAITYVPADFTITAKAITVTADSKTKVYGTVDPSLTYVASPSLETGDSFTGSLSRALGSIVGAYGITSTLSNTNYAITYVPADFTITAKAITVTAAAKTKVYGTVDPSLTYVVSPSLEAGDSFTGSLSRAAGSNVGAYGITSTLNNANYAITYVPANLTITAKAITVTAAAKTKVYGTVDPSLTYVVSPNLETGDSFTGSLTRATGTDIGTYVIASALNNTNYAVTYVPADFTITAKAITVTAAAKTKVYGTVDPSLTYVVSPNLETGDSFTGFLTRATGENVATYGITSTLNNANYAITYVPADFTITAKAITVTAAAKTKVYGTVDPSLTYVVSPSLETGDSFTGSLTRAAGINVGAYGITSTLNNANYAITYVPADFTITAKAITVTAAAKTKVYGTVDPSLTYVASPSLETGDSFTGSLSRALGSNVGAYEITSTLSNTNYAITYVPANLTITAKAITVTAAAKTKVYGTVDPSLTYVVSPNLETGDSFTGSLTRAAGTDIGTYVIASTLNNTNYAVTYVPADFTITAKAITVTAAAKTKVYGTVDPSLTYVVSPSLEAGDSFTGSLSRAAGSNVGAYGITSTLNNTNYAITYVPANLTITKANQTITWNQTVGLGCDAVTTAVLTAASTSGLPISYTSSNINVAAVSNEVLSFTNFGSATITATQLGDGNYNAASVITIPVLRSQPNLIRKHFDNVIFFDNSSDSFKSYTWYKNGMLVPGQTGQYFKESESLNGSYYAVGTKVDGAIITTCPLILSPSIEQEFLKIAPNPVRSNSSYQLITNVTTAKLQSARVTVISMLGKVLTDAAIDKNTLELIAPSVEGIYIVKMTLSNGQYFTKNLLVKN